MASASLMTERMKGLSVDEARAVFERAHAMFLSDPNSEVWPDAQELAALAGVREYPMRVKCASLPWHALRAALDSAQSVEG
jgi:nitrogen fixation NifU-like protein